MNVKRKCIRWGRCGYIENRTHHKTIMWEGVKGVRLKKIIIVIRKGNAFSLIKLTINHALRFLDERYLPVSTLPHRRPSNQHRWEHQQEPKLAQQQIRESGYWREAKPFDIKLFWMSDCKLTQRASCPTIGKVFQSCNLTSLRSRSTGGSSFDGRSQLQSSPCAPKPGESAVRKSHQPRSQSSGKNAPSHPPCFHTARWGCFRKHAQDRDASSARSCMWFLTSHQTWWYRIGPGCSIHPEAHQTSLDLRYPRRWSRLSRNSSRMTKGGPQHPVWLRKKG